MATMSAAQKARLHQLFLEGAVPYAALVAESGLNRLEFQKFVKNEKWGKWTKAANGSKAKAGPELATAGNDNVADAGDKGAGDVGAAAKTMRRARSNSAKQSAKKRKLTPKPTGLLKLVYGTIEKELGKLEKQEGLESQDRERASRALSQIMNSLEKAVEMQREITKDEARGGEKKDKEVLKDAEAKRKELAERIARFRASRAL
jgi:hypothetical protein